MNYLNSFSDCNTFDFSVKSFQPELIANLSSPRSTNVTEEQRSLPSSKRSSFLDTSNKEVDYLSPFLSEHNGYTFDFEEKVEKDVGKKMRLDIQKWREMNEKVAAQMESEDESTFKFKEISKKTRKYQIYTEEEKVTILNFLKKHGVQKTITQFSSSQRKLTQRKLRCWTESQRKIKANKGRKLENPAFDKAFLQWCFTFQQENGRAPNNKEAKAKALTMSEAENFKASKGWLRRFSVRHKFTFSTVKTTTTKEPKKRNSILSEAKTDFSGSTTETVANPAEGPQVGDEFFNFSENSEFFKNEKEVVAPVNYQLKDSFDPFFQPEAREDLDLYSFLKFDESPDQNLYDEFFKGLFT
jgi:hypothetical protein